MRGRKLSLKKDTLAELTSEELDAVVGGQEITKAGTQCFCSDFQACIPTNRCITWDACFTTNGCG